MENFLNQLVAFAARKHELTVTFRPLNPESGWFTVFYKDEEDNDLGDFDIRDLGEHMLGGRRIDMCEIRHPAFGYLTVEQNSVPIAALMFV